MTNTKKAISIIALVLLVVLGACSLGTGARKNTVKENKSENKEPKTETLDEKDKDNSETKKAEDKAKDEKTEDENAKNTDEKEETATVSENKTEKVDEKVESKVDEKSDTKASETQTTQSTKSETKTTTSKPATTQTSNTTSTPKSSSTSTPKASSTKSETKVDTPTSTKPSTQTKKTPVVTTKNVTETLPFSIVRKHNIDGAKTRISQQGKNGSVTYKVTYTDGVQTKKEEISRVNPQNEIIQTYVKVQDRVVEKREVDDLTKPVYGHRNPKDRWFVRNQETGEIKIFYNTDDLMKEVEEGNYLKNWGNYEPEWEEYLIGYEPKIVEVVTQEEKWDWR